MEPQLEVERYLEQLGTTMLDDAVLAHPKQRRTAMQASIASWGRTNYDATLALMEHPKRFCGIVLAFLEALWQQGFSAEWERQKTGLATHVEITRNRFSTDLANAIPDDVLFRLTGRHPAEEWMEPLRHSPHIILVPCAHMGDYLSITQVGDSQYIFYEPSASLSKPGHTIQDGRNATLTTSIQAVDREVLDPVLEVLGSATSLTILMILSSQGEMIAQQIAEHADVHQSTISRHFAQLERAGLVLVRRTAGMKYYTVNRQRIHDVCQLLLKIFGE
jgi:DNA-binding transcriptional ArsR family regulator